MNTRQLGKSQIQIPPIAFGGNVFGWTADEAMSFKILDELFELGFNYIDTANVYSRWAPGNQGGESEALIGKWMKQRGNRDKMIIATKVGMDVGQGKIDLSRAHIKEQIDLSLQRLNTDYVDIYFAHKYDQETEALETLAAFDRLISEGKVRCLGASNFPLARLRESEQIAKDQNLSRYEVYQPEYNLMQREAFEGDVQQFCLDNQIGVTSYFTLASGFLTGKYEEQSETEGRARESYMSTYFNDRGKRVLKALNEIAKNNNCTAAAVTLAWTMAQPGVTAPIASASNTNQLKAFKEALNLNLDASEISKLKEVSAL